MLRNRIKPADWFFGLTPVIAAAARAQTEGWAYFGKWEQDSETMRRLGIEAEQIVESVTSSEPIAHELPGHNWTVKKLRRWAEEKLGKPVSRSRLRTLLKQAGLSWKKCKKLLTKANPAKRARFVEEFQAHYERMVQGEVRILYIDEVHLHQDLDLGYTWAPQGKPAWRKSISPSLSQRINW